ncbi:YbdD/YjiX family protein [Rosenbergiella australiborealis]|uniref:YbdD/YjiX family protein n=1 Tax=Rosenbergiella australiborealis TaxID=1544696 RepID=UPI001F4E18FD|nr:CstA-like transporter-associated (seleno)protein [Rosenbergiella australiborealis]
MLRSLQRITKRLTQAGNMLIGIPDYDHYVEHMKQKHPESPIMDYKAFFRERQQARYAGKGKGGMRCC